MDQKEPHFTDIYVDPEEGEQIVSDFFMTKAVLSSKMRSRRLPTMVASYKSLSLRIPDIELTPDETWQQVGEKLREHYMAESNEPCKCDWCSRYQHTKRGQRENYWVTMVTFAILGDPSGLVEYLDSGRRLDRFDRMVLADLLNLAFRSEVDQTLHPNGRPRKIAAQDCAKVARYFYSTWKKLNRRSGVQDWGHSDEMKDEACRVAIEAHTERKRKGIVVNDHPTNVVPDFEDVRELMDRPVARLHGRRK
jgi:hypothetical protein